MAFLHSTLELIGSDPEILTVSDNLSQVHSCSHRTFEKDHSLMHILNLTILEGELTEEDGVARTTNWLNDNRETLEHFPGAMTLELLFALDIHDASRFVRMTAEVIELLFDLQCDLLLQYSKSYSGDGDPDTRSSEN